MSNRELLELAKNGDNAAREKVINDNTGLVFSIVKRFLNRGYEAEDLYQIGCIGLIKAVDKFDINYSVMFSTYAVPMIMGEIKRFLRDDGIVKISRTIKENSWKIRQEMDNYIHKYGKEPTVEEISKLTNISREDVILAIDSLNQVESIYRESKDENNNGLCLADKIANNERNELNSEKIIERITLEEAIGKLDEKEKKIIKMRYFEEKTQSEIAKILNMTQVQISRVEKKILFKLKKEMCNCEK